MANTSERRREDGRKPLMVYLDPGLIRALKDKALDDGTHVYLIVEDILRSMLKPEAKGPGSER